MSMRRDIPLVQMLIVQSMEQGCPGAEREIHRGGTGSAWCVAEVDGPSETLMAGYGSSSKPPGSESHVEYSKREMAEDAVQVMYAAASSFRSCKLTRRKHFGFDTFPIVAHDRGARVAHRLALDNPGRVSKLMVLDILPTLWMYEHTDQMFVSIHATSRLEGCLTI